jgi:hypothetical protein
MRVRVIPFVFAILLLPLSYANAEDVAAAAKAFAQAQEVMLAGDVSRAADLYELADGLAPSAPALRNAARARLSAKHHAMAATHAAELLRRYPGDKESRTVAEAILSMLGPQLAQVAVTCASSCTLSIDGKAVSASAREQYTFYTQPGARTILATFDDGRTATGQITGIANQTATLQLTAPPKPVEPVVEVKQDPVPKSEPVKVEPRRTRPTTGISRAWVLGGTIVTLGLGVSATLYGLKTLDTRDKLREQVDPESQATVDLFNKGRDQQMRTNILIGATAAAGITTIVLAFVTNWSPGERREEFAIVPTREGFTVAYGARF